MRHAGGILKNRIMDEEKERPRYQPPSAELRSKQKENPEGVRQRGPPTGQVRSYTNACPVRSRGRSSRPTSNGVKVRFSLCREGMGGEHKSCNIEITAHAEENKKG